MIFEGSNCNGEICGLDLGMKNVCGVAITRFFLGRLKGVSKLPNVPIISTMSGCLKACISMAYLECDRNILKLLKLFKPEASDTDIAVLLTFSNILKTINDEMLPYNKVTMFLKISIKREYFHSVCFGF